MALDRTMGMTSECAFTTEDSRAPDSMVRNNTFGHDGVGPNMIVTTSSADWSWAAAFNQRTTWWVDLLQEQATTHGATSGCGCCRRSTRRHFSNTCAPSPSSNQAERLTTMLFVALEACRAFPSLAHIGSRNTDTCAELAQVVRLFLSRVGIGYPHGHFALLRAMRRRHALDPLAMA